MKANTLSNDKEYILGFSGLIKPAVKVLARFDKYFTDFWSSVRTLDIDQVSFDEDEEDGDEDEDDFDMDGEDDDDGQDDLVLEQDMNNNSDLG